MREDREERTIRQERKTTEQKLLVDSARDSARREEMRSSRDKAWRNKEALVSEGG